MHAALRREGIEIGRDQTGRLMRTLGLAGVRRGAVRRTTVADGGGARPADLVERNFTAARPDQLWVTDIERHEALLNRAVVKGHRLRLVAAGR